MTTTMGTCPNTGCTAESPCPSCRTRAFENIAKNPEAIAEMNLDNVFESAVIRGILAITWRDDNGEPIKNEDGSIARGLPKLMAEDFWSAYSAAKKEGLQKIAEVIARSMAESPQAEQNAQEREPEISGAPVSEDEERKTRAEISALLEPEADSGSPTKTRVRRPRTRTAKKVISGRTNGTNSNGSSASSSSETVDSSEETPESAPSKPAH